MLEQVKIETYMSPCEITGICPSPLSQVASPEEAATACFHTMAAIELAGDYAVLKQGNRCPLTTHYSLAEFEMSGE